MSQELLTTLATELWHESRTVVPAALDGDTTVSMPTWQRELVASQGCQVSAFQMPDPIIGATNHPTWLVIGLNPGFDRQAIMPTFDTPLDEYIAFYRDRFVDGKLVDRRVDDAGTRVIPHYRRVEAIMADSVPALNLGISVAYADAIPWKSHSAALKVALRDPAALEYARARVWRIITSLSPTVVISLGVFAASCMHHRAKPRKSPAVRQVGRSEWSGPVLPLYHPSARGVTREYWDRAAARIAELRRSEGAH